MRDITHRELGLSPGRKFACMGTLSLRPAQVTNFHNEREDAGGQKKGHEACLRVLR